MTKLKKFNDFFKERNIDIDEAYNVSKALLIRYNETLWLPEKTRNSIDLDEKGHIKRFLSCESNVKDTPITVEFFQSALPFVTEIINGYPDDRPLYNKILEKCYFENKWKKEFALLEELKMGRTTFYNKKREAIILFFIGFSSFILSME